MKCIVCCLLTLICLQSKDARAQGNIAVVDFDTVVATFSLELRLDSIYHSGEAALTLESARRVKVFENHYIVFHRMLNGCLTPSAYESEMKKLKQEQDSLIAFQKIVTDSLPALYNELLADIEYIIQAEIKTFAMSNQFDLVSSKRELLFFNSAIDKTDEVFRRISKSDTMDLMKKRVDEFALRLSELLKN